MVSAISILPLLAYENARILFAGDPNQLMPICENQVAIGPRMRPWFTDDMFRFFGVVKETGFGLHVACDDRIAKIEAQRRCSPNIWRLVQSLYPNVECFDVNEINQDARILDRGEVNLLDLSSGEKLTEEIRGKLSKEEIFRYAVQFSSACIRFGKSWINPPTALFCAQVVRDLADRSPYASIGIVTPFRAQAALIKRFISEEGIERDFPNLKIRVGTIHAFQGGEADTIIFDFCEGPPKATVCPMFLGDTGRRLLNVAITRAKKSLYIIGDINWIESLAQFRPNFAWNQFFRNKQVISRRYPVVFDNSSVEKPRSGGYAIESPIQHGLAVAINKRLHLFPIMETEYRIYDNANQIISRADIAFPSLKLAIFCDGGVHREKENWNRDMRIRNRLQINNWNYLVFSGRDINQDADRCVDDIIRWLQGAQKIDVRI
jgi:hypothetical protein